MQASSETRAALLAQATPSAKSHWSLRAQQWGGRILLYLAVAAGALVFLFPLFWLVSSSLKPEGDIFLFPPNLWPSQVMFGNYPAALSNFPFLQTGLNTMIIVLGVEVGRLISASLAAYAFARVRIPWRRTLFVLVLSTMMLPYHVTLIPQYILFRDLGWLNSFKPLIVPSFFGGGAFFIFLLRQFFLTLPKELEDAAKILEEQKQRNIAEEKHYSHRTGHEIEQDCVFAEPKQRSHPQRHEEEEQNAHAECESNAHHQH